MLVVPVADSCPFLSVTNMRLVDRYITRHLILPFIIGVLIFVVILVGDEARKLGAVVLGLRVSPQLIGQYLLYCTPQAVVWSLPVGTLVGVAMAVTALARNGETVAMRAAGASFTRICAGFLVVGVVTSATAFAISEAVVPSATEAAHRVFEQLTRTQPVVREEYNQFFRDETGRIFYVRHMNADTNQLSEIMIWQEDARGRLVSITAARRATLEGPVWVLEEGRTVYLDAEGQPQHQEQFARQPIKLHQAIQKYYADKRTPLEMTASELDELARNLEATGQSAHQLQVYRQFKYAIPVACLVFVLIAAPLADRYAHLGSFAGILIAIILVFLYNGVRSWGLAFGLTGILPPVLAAWAQNIIFGAVGLYLLGTQR